MAYIDIGGGTNSGPGGGLIPFAPVLLVAVNPITPSGVHSIDGHATGDLQRVLLTAQADPIQNGIWLTDGLGTWQRPADLPVGANSSFAFAFVQEGDVYANTGWANGSVPTSIVGTDPQTWVQVIAPGSLVANNGLTLTGSTLDVTPDADGSLVATPHNLKVGVISDAQHGDRGGGSLHALVTPAVAGFMSAPDKVKLDLMPATGGVPATRLIVTGNGLAGGGDLSMDRTHVVVPNPDGSIVVGVTGVGVGTLATDAQHGARGGGLLHAPATGAADGFMPSSAFVKLLGIENNATNTPLSSTLPTGTLPDAVGAPGVSTEASRADHVHANTTDAPVSVTKSPNSEGLSVSFARADHKHDVATAAPVTVGTANTEGVATTLARSDHTHAHGAQTDPALHAVATSGTHGFMSATDKAKLDTVGPGASSAMLAWGNTAISGTTTTRYMSPYYGTVLAPTSPTQYRVSRGGTIRNMRVRHNQPLGNGLNIVYTLRVNDVATTLAVTLSSTGTDASNLAVSIPVLAGDLVDIEVTKAASIATSPNEIIITAEFAN
jgi:hypothetical protein